MISCKINNIYDRGGKISSFHQPGHIGNAAVRAEGQRIYAQVESKNRNGGRIRHAGLLGGERMGEHDEAIGLQGGYRLFR